MLGANPQGRWAAISFKHGKSGLLQDCLADHNN
jgi:hypothetical protein